jgi:hypothetical protein
VSARRSPVEAVLTAIVSTLRASAGVSAIATGGVYNNVPQGTAFPYLEVSCPSDRPVDTCGRFGAELLVDVKAVSQAFGDQEPSRMLDQAIRALNFQRPTLSEHETLGVTWESGDRFREVVNGIITRHHVATFRVWTQQSST